MSRALILMVLPATLSLAACSEDGKPAASPAATVTAPARTTDAGQLARGTELYRAHCAACHGSHAQGALRWQQPGPDGKYPAPPLDGSAHAWHHPLAALKDTIRNGTARLGGNMPPWRNKLTEADIEAVIACFQSLWPAEIYRAWADIDRRARRQERRNNVELRGPEESMRFVFDANQRFPEELRV